LSEPRRVFAEIAGRLPQKKLTKVQPKRIINSLLDEFRQLLTKAEPCCPPLAEVPKAEVVNALNNNISHIPPPTPSRGGTPSDLSVIALYFNELYKTNNLKLTAMPS